MSLGVQQLAGFGSGRRAAGGGTFTPVDLFNGTSDGSDGTENGGWWDMSDNSNMWQVSTGTGAVTSAGDTVERVDDKSGNGNDIVEATGAWEWQTNYIVRKDFATSEESFAALTISGAYTIFAAVRWLDDTQSSFRGLAAINSNSMLLMRSSVDKMGTFGSTNYPSSYEVVQDTDVVVGMNWAGTGTGGTFYENGNTALTYASTGGQARALGGQPGQATNMRVYQLVTIDRQLTSQELSDLQTWMATKF